MRMDDALNDCIIVEFKLTQGPETVAFCVTDRSLYEPFRKSFAKSYDTVAAYADVRVAIASASKEQTFDIAYGNSGSTLAETTIQFGDDSV